MIASAQQEVLNNHNNIIQDAKAMDRLFELGVDYIPCSGMYEGTVEFSFFINVQTKEMYDILKAMFFELFNQECILVLKERKAELVYKTGEIESMGTFTAVCQHEAERNGAYTHMDKKYYVCKQVVNAPEWGSCSESTKQAESEMLHSKDHPCFVTEGQLASEVEV